MGMITTTSSDSQQKGTFIGSVQMILLDISCAKDSKSTLKSNQS